MRKIDKLDDLHALYGAVSAPARRKVASRLTPLYQAWIEASRFCILSTVGPDGVDGSPRGDDGPVVTVLDPHHLAMPDWRGNNRLDSLRNIVRDPRVALIFMVPGSKTLVRVNGRACLTDDTSLRARFEKGDKRPATVIVIEIQEIYTQCAKAVMRADIWNRDDTPGLPTVGQILAEMTDGEEGGADYDANYGDYAKPRMW